MALLYCYDIILSFCNAMQVLCSLMAVLLFFHHCTVVSSFDSVQLYSGEKMMQQYHCTIMLCTVVRSITIIVMLFLL